MHKKPLVAIHCLVYNHEPYLRDCFEGFVMQQTNFPFVAIVHDDASTDNSAAIIREYEVKYPNIFKPIYETENQFSKRDGSLEHIMHETINALGVKYVAFCEGDDNWINPRKLQIQVDYLEKNLEYGMCYTDFNIYNDQTKKTIFSYYSNVEKPILSFTDHLFMQGFIGPMTWLYRLDTYNTLKDTIPKCIIDKSYAIALEFFANSKVAYLPITTATYREHSESASHPSSLEARFLYRKSIYEVEKYYAKKYLNNKWLELFILQLELNELYLMAYKINNKEYIDWCNSICLSNPLVDVSLHKWVLYLQKELCLVHHSYAYRIGKLIIHPISKLKKYLYRIKK